MSLRDGKQTPFLSPWRKRQQYTIKSRGFNLKSDMRLATIKKLPLLDFGTIIRHQLPCIKIQKDKLRKASDKYMVLSMLRNLSLYLLGQLNAVCKPKFKDFFQKNTETYVSISLRINHCRFSCLNFIVVSLYLSTPKHYIDQNHYCQQLQQYHLILIQQYGTILLISQ